MKANFGAVNMNITDEWLDERAEYISNSIWQKPGKFREESVVPTGFEGYYCVDVLGQEFDWMNSTFPKEKFKWYLWFESVFLVPEEMVPFLKLRWG